MWGEKEGEDEYRGSPPVWARGGKVAVAEEEEVRGEEREAKEEEEGMSMAEAGKEEEEEVLPMPESKLRVCHMGWAGTGGGYWARTTSCLSFDFGLAKLGMRALKPQ